MVMGTSSSCGKSWLATGLCRWYSNKGFKVAPFKAQNMSNNARVVPTASGEYGEIGSAQYFQALAARSAPDVRMNPLLLKPESDTHSQVVLMGKVDARLSQLPWSQRASHIWEHVSGALDALRADNDIVIIEGAGSPAEINLRASDIVNMRIAQHANAHSLVVTDIDRGGAFAHLYGTWALLPQEERKCIHGFVLNKFRGDPGLLEPGPRMLKKVTGVPTVATIPMVRNHGLPEEDGVFDAGTYQSGRIHTTIAVLAYPHISNFDEFQPLKNVRGVRLVWARTPADLAGVDWIIMPGSKATASDMQWLRNQGLAHAIVHHARRGQRILGICGGLQMLGEALIDAEGVDGNVPGLGLLPLVTQFAHTKIVRPSSHILPELPGPWQKLSRLPVQGYEIHHGQTEPHPAMLAAGHKITTIIPRLAWSNEQGNILGLYLHGLFENSTVLDALFGQHAFNLEQVFDRLAQGVDAWFAAAS